MTDLREKVARAMAPSVFKDFDPSLHGSPAAREFAMKAWAMKADDAIQAVLEALKVPSGAMVLAGMTTRVDHPEKDNTLSRHERLTAGIYKAMLTAFTRDHYLSELAEEDGKLLE